MGKISDRFTGILAKPRNLKETDDKYLILKYGVESRAGAFTNGIKSRKARHQDLRQL